MDGESFPLEAHFVHQLADDPNGGSVVGEVGSNSELDRIFIELSNLYLTQISQIFTIFRKYLIILIWMCIENENDNGNELVDWYENVWK